MRLVLVLPVWTLIRCGFLPKVFPPWRIFCTVHVRSTNPVGFVIIPSLPIFEIGLLFGCQTCLWVNIRVVVRVDVFLFRLLMEILIHFRFNPFFIIHDGLVLIGQRYKIPVTRE